jgi:hypothetical protein
MKKYLALLIVGVVLASCGGDGGGDDPPTPPPAENEAPSVPAQVYPANNDLCINNSVAFKWNAATDPENNPITYQVEVVQTKSGTTITRTTSATSITIDLEKGVEFYWKIKATDSKGLSSANSGNNQFYTEGVGVSNHLPFSPTLVAPLLNATVQTSTASLQWTASDVDSGDTLSYDVYFGQANPPTAIVVTGQAATSYTATLASSKTYYWKIVVKDGKGGQTVGQIWNFKTD